VGTDSGGGFLPAFTFTLPESRTSASEISLLARPVLDGALLDRECSTPQCSFAQQRSIGGLRFSDTGLFVIRSVAMTYTGSPTLPDPVSAFDAASNLSPVAVLPSPYQATRDLTAIRKSCTKPDGSFCDAINDKVKADI